MTRLQDFLKTLSDKGAKTYYVGGYVRDMILGKENKDIDIEIHYITEKEFLDVCKSFCLDIKLCGQAFGVYKAVIDGQDIDFSFPRTEKLIGTKHTDFEIIVDPFIGEEKASQRRDFTINALMMDTQDGTILDFHKGMKDLEDKIISIKEKNIHIFGSVYLNSKEKFQKYLDNNKNLLSIKKLRNNIELDAEDLKELKQLLYSNEEVDLESLKNENNSEIEKISSVYGKNESFGIFIRSLVGLDREAINREFSEFLNTEKFNSNQIELINLIIENIVKYGAYSKNEIPKLSNDILGKSIFNIFTNENDLQKIVDIINKINSNAPKLL